MEVVTFVAVFVRILDDTSFHDAFRKDDSLVVILNTREDFVGIAVQQSDESHPFFFVVLEAYHVAFQYLRTFFRHFGTFAGKFRLFFLVLHGNHHARTRTVAIDGTTLASRTPGFHIELIDQFFVHIVRQVDRHADTVVHPLLDGSLHFDFHQPVHVVGRGLIIRRTCHQFIDFLLRVTFLRVVAVDFHPREELMVIDDVFLESVARLVNEVDMYFRVVRVNLAPTFVHGQEYRFDAGCGLRHEAGRPRRGNGEASDVASSVFYHVFIQFRVCLT